MTLLTGGPNRPFRCLDVRLRGYRVTNRLNFFLQIFWMTRLRGYQGYRGYNEQQGWTWLFFGALIPGYEVTGFRRLHGYGIAKSSIYLAISRYAALFRAICVVLTMTCYWVFETCAMFSDCSCGRSRTAPETLGPRVVDTTIISALVAMSIHVSWLCHKHIFWTKSWHRYQRNFYH